ncbi:hypothetical protein KOI35_38755 [Actinoplanes bogorensis]|uniref:Gram-positive cocci surface proteins LPxTG domain-containing protein n=1 Tax=Paractinoplanes bogorensis TaxID=1610840 RepID=A0ABS5Z3F1_9ACTN|nr:hypothetical protein [Actinoplanes bogorensis]MBU2669468.1 hypothetical protein [Actinoplanes bogorensis]
MRLPVPAALAALALGLSVLFIPLGAAPAAAARAALFLELSPSTVPAGDEVGLRASCDDNLKAATVTSGLFGSVTVAPRFGFLTATAQVPGNTRPGDYRIDLSCPDGATASATLHVVAKVQPARGPATGAGGTAPGRNAPLLIGGGLAIVAMAAGLGVVSLRRRRLG